MTWDAVLFGFEGALADLTSSGRWESRRYHDGRRGVAIVRDAGGHSSAEYLKRAQAAGLPLGVISSSPVQAVIRWFQEHELIRPPVVIGYHDTVLHRPSPDPIRVALHRLGVVPSERVVFLGDSADDVVAACRAGVTSATLRSEAPVLAPPTLFFDNPDALLERDLAYALAGSFDPERASVSLHASLDGVELQLGGRLSEPALAALLVDGAEGKWSSKATDLAHRLVIHALGARPEGALLTWLPGLEDSRDSLAELVSRLCKQMSLPSRRMFRRRAPEAGSSGWELVDPHDLSRARVLVLCALRSRGEALGQVARLLRAAGATQVFGLALAQEQRPGASLMATWGPRRIANDELRRMRSRRRGGDVDGGASTG